jgi:hypothetical protein
MRNTSGVTRNNIQAAIERNVPFSIRMADGREYRMPHSDYISLSPTGTTAVVYDDLDHVWVLPLLTMTGLSYSEHAAKKKSR